MHMFVSLNFHNLHFFNFPMVHHGTKIVIVVAFLEFQMTRTNQEVSAQAGEVISL